MKILLTGASGFVGSHLIDKLLTLGHQVVALSRQPKLVQSKYCNLVTCYKWDALAGLPPEASFSDVDAVINLMGEGVANRRWSAKQKDRLYQTRVNGTRNLVAGINAYRPNLATFISASAVGYYDHNDETPKHENSAAGTDFLSKICVDWEHEANQVTAQSQTRCVLIRLGIILGDGGALAKIKIPFLAGLGGRLGSGKQWFNWIHIDDVVGLITTALTNDSMQAAYNAVAPDYVTNAMFTRTLARVLKRPAICHVPSIALKIVLGELSQEVLRGQRVLAPNDKFAYEFKYPTLVDALEAALSIKYIDHLGQKVRCRRFYERQFLNQEPKAVFEFFSDVHNLERITPPLLKFQILSQTTPSITEGTLFTYKLRIRGIPVRWKSLIAVWQPKTHFVDTQLSGPYRVWHHTHRFTPYQTGTMIEDEVLYALPRIPLMSLVAPLISRDIRSIFRFRQHTIARLFAPKTEVAQ